MGSNAGNIIKQLAPVVVGAATGNPWLGAAVGAGIGATNGGKGTLLQAGLGGLQGYGGASLGSSAANALSSAGGITGALSSAGDGISSFLSHPLDSIGSAISGAGTKLSGLLSGSGTADITAPGVSGAGSLLTSGGNAAGKTLDLTGSGTGGLLTAGAPAASASGLVSGGALSAAGTGAATGGSSFGSGGFANLLSGVGNILTQDQAQDDLLKSQNASLDALKPFLANGTGASNALADKLGTSGNTGASGYGDLTKAFTPGDLTQDPGYQFNLEQGNNALNNRLAASGMLGSGAALKEAQQFGQGLADTTYNNAFNRDLATKNQQYGALSGAATPGLQAGVANQNVNTNIGLTNASHDVAQGNTITGTLSNLLTGGGTKQIIGYKPDGTPIYA